MPRAGSGWRRRLSDPYSGSVKTIEQTQSSSSANILSHLSFWAWVPHLEMAVEIFQHWLRHLMVPISICPPVQRERVFVVVSASMPPYSSGMAMVRRPTREALLISSPG